MSLGQKYGHTAAAGAGEACAADRIQALSAQLGLSQEKTAGLLSNVQVGKLVPLDCSYRDVDGTLKKVGLGATVEIEISIDVPVKVEKIMVSNDIVNFFDILSVKVGRDEQLTASGRPLSASALCPENGSYPVDFDQEPCSTSLKLRLTVRNNDVADQFFKAMYWVDCANCNSERCG